MKAFLKEIIIPIVVVLGVLLSCLISICIYHWVMYNKERQFYEALAQKESEMEARKKKKNVLQPSLSRDNSINSISTVSKMIQYNSIEDLRPYLGLRNVDITAKYCYDGEFLQISLKRIFLYPLPENVQESFIIYYKLRFCAQQQQQQKQQQQQQKQQQQQQQSFESDTKPLRSPIQFNEIWRIYPHLSDLTDGEITCQIFICDRYFAWSLSWSVKYELNPKVSISLDSSSHAGTNQLASSNEDNEGMDQNMNKLVQISCEKMKTENEAQPMIHFSLCYKPTAGRIYLKLMEGKDFPVTAHDCRIRVTLVQTKYGSVRSFYSNIIPSQSNPSFDDIFTLGIAIKNIQSVMIIITLMYGIHRRSFSDIAEVKIGGNVIGEQQQQHWNEMLSSVREDISSWHPLTNVFIS